MFKYIIMTQPTTEMNLSIKRDNWMMMPLQCLYNAIFYNLVLFWFTATATELL